MFHKFLLVLMLAVWPALATDLLVLKNGKRFKVENGYEVKGQYVVFEQNGELRQLPLKMVDLDKSKQATQEYLAKEEAKRKAAQAKPEPKPAPKYSEMSDIAEYVESTRTKDNPRKEGVAISSDGLGKYSSNNPAPKNAAVEFTMSVNEENTPEAREAAKEELGERYLQTKADIAELDLRITEAEDYAELLASESAFGDDPTGKFYQKMEEADAKVEILKQNREDKKKELKDIEREARKRGIRGISRYKGKKKRN